MLLIKIILVVFSFSVNSYIVPAFFVVLRGHLNPRSYVRKMQTKNKKTHLKVNFRSFSCFCAFFVVPLQPNSYMLMKKLSFILLTIIFAANTFAATITIPEEAKDWNIPAEAIDVLQAREICKNLSAGATTGTKYYVMGYIKKIDSNHATNVSKYGNASFYIEQVKGANSTEDFYAYRV